MKGIAVCLETGKVLPATWAFPRHSPAMELRQCRSIIRNIWHLFPSEKPGFVKIDPFILNWLPLIQ